MRLAPTVMPLSSSIYNAMELKNRGRKQVRKTPQLFYLTGNLGEEETSPLRGTPASALSPQGSRTTKRSVPCADASIPPFFEPRWLKCDRGVLFFVKGEKVEAVGRACRQKIPISILFFKLWLDKRETELERPIQKSQAENRSQACAWSVMSHLSALLGINVSSPVSHPALRLALPLHKDDFIRSQRHVQSAHASQDAADLVLTPPGHRKPKEQTSGSNGFLIHEKAIVLRE